ncbi:unnamed protein product, partial [Allacma fusca]
MASKRKLKNTHRTYVTLETAVEETPNKSAGTHDAATAQNVTKNFPSTSKKVSNDWLTKLSSKHKNQSEIPPELHQEVNVEYQSPQNNDSSDFGQNTITDEVETGTKVMKRKDYVLNCRQCKDAFIYVGHKYRVVDGVVD